MPMDLRRSRSEKKRKEKKRHRVLSKSESTRWVGVLDVRVLPRVQGDQMHPSPLSPKVVEVKCSSKGLAARDSPVLHIPHRLITRHLKDGIANPSVKPDVRDQDRPNQVQDQVPLDQEGQQGQSRMGGRVKRGKSPSASSSPLAQESNQDKYAEEAIEPPV